ncbi:hypothetical protein SLS56_009968 [Neofusicoccum ribis]|uniref:Cytochrome P450 n=1 Tax=Neofusicoccum ribis TaxID=45134 RepID=A0ABR3SFV2_9PEZI
MSAATALWTVVGLTLTWAASLIVYRLFIHPLARFPGPKFAAATRWYEFYFEIVKSPGGQFHRELNRMHDQYGPIVRITPNELHVRDSSWFDVLYASNPTHRDKYPPAAQLAGLPLGTHGTVQHDLHRKRRTANAPMFSKRAVASAQDLIREHVNELAEVFATKVGNDEPVELQTTFLAYTTDTIYHYMFDKDSGYQRNPEAAKSWRRSMQAVSQATPFMKQFPWLLSRVMLLPDWVLQWGLTRAQPDVAGLLGTHKLMAEIVSNYVAADRTPADSDKKVHDEERAFSKPKTIFQAIENSALPAHEKSPSRLAQEGLTVLFAGGETGSRVLANTVYHLLANPDILNKVKGEIFEAAEGSEKLPDVKVLERLPWLNPISMSIPDIVHSENIFPEPMKFMPERWFNATDLQNRYFVPFGKGTRMCVGME